MPIEGTVQVSGIIAPSSTADTYPVTDPQYGLGGLRTVATVNERNAIPTERRQAGMIVYVSSVGEWYALGNDLSSWTAFNPGSSGLPIVITSPTEGDLLVFKSSSTKFENSPRDEVLDMDGGNF
jgi:hypothetical protein